MVSETKALQQTQEHTAHQGQVLGGTIVQDPIWPAVYELSHFIREWQLLLLSLLLELFG